MHSLILSSFPFRDSYVVSYGLQSLGFGFSLTNEFAIDMAVFDGQAVMPYTAHPTAFQQLTKQSLTKPLKVLLGLENCR